MEKIWAYVIDSCCIIKKKLFIRGGMMKKYILTLMAAVAFFYFPATAEETHPECVNGVCPIVFPEEENGDKNQAEDTNEDECNCCGGDCAEDK